jgi:hypothetical protein
MRCLPHEGRDKNHFKSINRFETIMGDQWADP